MLNNSESKKRKTLEKKYRKKKINLNHKIQKTIPLSDIYKKRVKNEKKIIEKNNINLYEKNNYLLSKPSNEKLNNTDSIQTLQKATNLHFSLFNLEKEFKQFKILFPKNTKINSDNMNFIFKYFKLLVNNIYSKNKGYHYSKLFSKKNCEKYLKNNEHKKIFLKDVFIKIKSIFEKISENRLDKIQSIRDKSLHSIHKKSLIITENKNKVSLKKNKKSFNCTENINKNNLKKIKNRKSLIIPKSNKQTDYINHKKPSKARMSYNFTSLGFLKDSLLKMSKKYLKKKKFAKSFNSKDKKEFTKEVIKKIKLTKLKNKKIKNKKIKTKILNRNIDKNLKKKKKII